MFEDKNEFKSFNEHTDKYFVNMFTGAKKYLHGFLWLNSTRAGCSGVIHSGLFKQQISHPRTESEKCQTCVKLNLKNHLH